MNIDWSDLGMYRQLVTGVVLNNIYVFPYYRTIKLYKHTKNILVYNFNKSTYYEVYV